MTHAKAPRTPGKSRQAKRRDGEHEAPKSTVHVISHTHWDREWYLTFEEYRARLVDLVDVVLDRMASDPGFTFFHLDGQAIVVQDYLEIRPEREVEIRARVAEGRLLIGPWYVMPDMFLVSGEAMVRNLALGIRTAESYGRSMRVGYIPDPFGHIAQMPQILAGFGLDGAILWRGFGGAGAEYTWEAPDGTRALLLHLPPDGYCNGLRLPLAPPDRRARETKAVLDFERNRSRSKQVLLMVGVDHVEPHPELLDLVQAIEGMAGYSARLSTLPEFVRAASAATATQTLETIRGELRGGQNYSHLLPGVFSARTYLKQANAAAQRELEQWAEPVTALARLSGTALQGGTLRYAWRTLLQNHPHDSICGCSIDAVHDENMTRFARVRQAAATIADRAVQAIARGLPPAPATAVRAVVLNTDLKPWSGVLEATVEIPLKAVKGFRDVDIQSVEDPLAFFGDEARVARVSDAGGRDLPFQVLDEQTDVSFRMSRYAPPVGVHVRRVRLAVWVSHVPALGYSAIDVHVTPRGAQDLTPRRQEAKDEDLTPRRQEAKDEALTPRRQEAKDEALTPRRQEAKDEALTPRRQEAKDEDLTRRRQGDRDTVRADARSIENGRLRVQVRSDGAVDVIDKRTGMEYQGVFAIEDSGDVGDEYNYSPPASDRRITNAQARSHAVRRHERGPLSGSLTIEYSLGVPVSASADRRARAAESVDVDVVVDVRLKAASDRVECCVRLHNRAKDHRVRILCPAGAAAPSHRADTAFGLVERPSTPVIPDGPLVETPVATGPMQSLVDAGGDSAGATVVTDGLVEYEVLPEGLIAVTLLRSVGDLSREDLSTRKGHAGPGLSTPGAQCPGSHEFRLAFIPRGAPPSAGTLLAQARGFLSPPRVVSPAGGDGRLPLSASLLAVAAEPTDGVVLSAFKVAEDRGSVILRLFNPLDVESRMRISLPGGVTQAYLTNLAEERGAALGVKDGSVSLALPPHRIQTVELSPGGTHA